MKIGALIITTGLPRISGVTALLSEVGAITAGQRMISSFQSTGSTLVGLVVGAENKKAERQFAQNGVVFLRCNEPDTDFFHGLQQGIAFMQNNCDRVLIVPGDAPLFLPQTVRTLCSKEANIVIAEHNGIQGFPIVLDQQAMAIILNQKNAAAAEEALKMQNLQILPVSVEDPGVLLRGSDMSNRKKLIQQHNKQLSRPVTEVTLCSGGTLYDSRLSMLLHLVECTRSVRDACSLMQISYSAAWKMLNHAEDELGYPLVSRIRGGVEGSGSVLTEKGKALTEAYDRFSEQLNQDAQRLYDQFFEQNL